MMGIIEQNPFHNKIWSRSNQRLADAFFGALIALIGFAMVQFGFPLLFVLANAAIIFKLYSIHDQLTPSFIVESILLAFVKGFFREIGQRGAHEVPLHGPVIFVCAPHANQFLDPLIVVSVVPRKVSFIAAAVSMRRKYVGALARALDSIPVERAQDLAKAGRGKITTQEKGLRVIGSGTNFKEAMHPGMTIIVKGEALTIKEIVNDSEIITTGGTALEEDVTQPVAYSYAEKVDQTEVFTHVWQRLGQGECVGIFPEGGSHDRSDLLPLKAGVTIMALGAAAKYPGLKIRIVPCGLNYFSGHRFRSRAYVDIGPPLTVPSDLVEKYKQGGLAKREACTTLLETIQKRLRGVTVTAPNYEMLHMLWAVRRLYEPEGFRLAVDQKLELTRRFEEYYTRLSDNPTIIQLRTQVEEYNKNLRAYGLRDHQVNKTAVSKYYALTRLIFRGSILIVYAVFALPGLVLSAPVGLIARFISDKKAADAVSKSSVKLTGKDVIATWKILVTMVLAPLTLIIYPTIAALIGRWSGYGALRVWAYFALFQPFVIYGAVRFVESGRDIARSLVPLWYAVRNNEGVEALVKQRKELQRSIRDTVDSLGTSLFGPGFEGFRVVPKQSYTASNSNDDDSNAGNSDLDDEHTTHEHEYHDADLIHRQIPVNNK